MCVTQGKIPLVIDVVNADAIAALLRLKAEAEDELDTRSGSSSGPAQQRRCAGDRPGDRRRDPRARMCVPGCVGAVAHVSFAFLSSASVDLELELTMCSCTDHRACS